MTAELSQLRQQLIEFKARHSLTNEDIAVVLSQHTENPAKGISVMTVWGIINGKRKRIHPRTMKALMSLLSTRKNPSLPSSEKTFVVQHGEDVTITINVSSPAHA